MKYLWQFSKMFHPDIIFQMEKGAGEESQAVLKNDRVAPSAWKNLDSMKPSE